MPKICYENVEIYYETRGNPSDIPLLMIMGLGEQLTRWNENFCQKLIESGFYLILYDNRDTGFSTWYDDFGVPNIMEATMKFSRGEKIDTPYTFEEMAEDALRILDDLGIQKAFALGISMGGMIAQTLAIENHDRLSGIILIMTGSGNTNLSMPKPEIVKMMVTPAPTDHEGYINHNVKLMKLIYGTYPFNEDASRDTFIRNIERSYHPVGFSRHYITILENGDRSEKLKKINTPALIIHGHEDPLVPVEQGIQLSKVIPKSKLKIIERMGHSLPPESWDEIFVNIVDFSKNN